MLRKTSEVWSKLRRRLPGAVIEGHAVGIVRGRAQPTYIGDHAGGVGVAIVGGIL